MTSDNATRGVLLVKLQAELLRVHKDAVAQIEDNALVGFCRVEQEPRGQNSGCHRGKQKRANGKQQRSNILLYRLWQRPVDAERN